MPKVLYNRDADGVIGVSIRLDSGEKVWILFSKYGCVVRKQGFFIKPRLYYEPDTDAVIKMAAKLMSRFSDQTAPPVFHNHILYAVANAVWHCASIAEVKSVFRNA